MDKSEVPVEYSRLKF